MDCCNCRYRSLSTIIFLGGRAVKTKSPANSGSIKKVIRAGVVDPRKSLDIAKGLSLIHI